MLIREVLGRWSSNRPTGGGRTPNDTAPDGIFEFKTYDPLTGAVTGDYYDVKIHETRPFQGTITFNGGDNYVFVLSHVVPPTDPPRLKRIYKGQTVADDGSVVVIVGRWQEVPLRQNRSEQEKESIDTEAALSGQNDGVWVATKP